MSRIRRKWRPPLSLLVAVVVGAVFALPTLGMAAVIAFTRSPDALLASIEANIGKIAVAEALLLMAAAGVGYVFWRGLARPLRNLAALTDQVTHGARDFSVGGPLGTREVALLAESFALLVERLQQRSRYLETFTAHLAHELKSPLAAIQGAAELLADDGMPPAQRQRFLQNILGDVARLGDLVAELRELARVDLAHDAGSTPLGAIVAALRDSFPALIVRLEGDPETVIPLTRESALVVFQHLADNAGQHGATALTITSGAEGIAVENDGRPIEPGNRDNVFTPFFTTRREAGGTGLGLAIAAAILAGAGGTIVLESPDPVRFRFSFGATPDNPKH